MTKGIRIRRVREDLRNGAAWEAVRARIGSQLPDEPLLPEARPYLAWRGEEPVARLALGLSDGLIEAPDRTGWIGWYEARDPESGVALLLHAREVLSRAGAVRVIGPFHGSTWNRYRLVLREQGPNEPPPFLSEPWNPPDYPDHFAAAGFQPIAAYESRIAPPADEADLRRAAEARSRLAESGVAVRPLDSDRFDEELRRIHELSLDAFARNRFYSPLGEERFRAMYRPIRSLLDPSLILLAESRDGELLGFSFSFLDPNAPPDRPRLILKTLATASRARGAGLGSALVSLTHASDAARGAEVVHALIEAGNLSRRISSGHQGECFRRYALFAAPPS